jgi:hypothetical protein
MPKTKLVAAAIKKPSGKVVSKPPPARHKDVAAQKKKKGSSSVGERGFKTTSGKFVGRQEAKKMTGKPKRGKRGTHSEDMW